MAEKNLGARLGSRDFQKVASRELHALRSCYFAPLQDCGMSNYKQISFAEPSNSLLDKQYGLTIKLRSGKILNIANLIKAPTYAIRNRLRVN